MYDVVVCFVQRTWCFKGWFWPIIWYVLV